MADRTRRKPAGKLPITSHPLFPVIVMLWFGALFGLASLAIRPALIESVVLATGLHHVIPKAAPPLGTTSRILIALMMTGLGCLAGILVARRLAAAPNQEPSTRRRRPADSADAASPISLFGGGRHNSDADDADDEAEEAPTRRRQLAIRHEEEDTFDDHAPLPGGAQILNVADLDLDGFEHEQEAWLRSTTRREVPSSQLLQDWDDPVAQDYEDEPEDDLDSNEPAHEPTARFDAFRQVAREMTASEPAADDHKRSNRLFESYVGRVNAGVGSNDSQTVPAPGFVSLRELGAENAMPVVMPHPVLAEESDEHHDTYEASEPARASDGAKPSGPFEDDRVTPPYANAAERIASAPLDALSHVELLDRLAQTIARRRAEWARAADAKAAAETAALAIDIVPVAEMTPVAEIAPAAAEATSSGQADPAAVPAALRPHWGSGDTDDDADALPGYVPPRHMTSKPIGSTVTDADEDVLSQGYSSLLGMIKPAARPDPVADHPADLASAPPPPVFAFPGLRGVSSSPAAKDHEPSPAPDRVAAPIAPRAFDAPQGSGEVSDATEQALRDALATLRRMSGAA